MLVAIVVCIVRSIVCNSHSIRRPGAIPITGLAFRAIDGGFGLDVAESGARLRSGADAWGSPPNL